MPNTVDELKRKALTLAARHRECLVTMSAGEAGELRKAAHRRAERLREQITASLKALDRLDALETDFSVAVHELKTRIEDGDDAEEGFTALQDALAEFVGDCGPVKACIDCGTVRPVAEFRGRRRCGPCQYKRRSAQYAKGKNGGE